MVKNLNRKEKQMEEPFKDFFDSLKEQFNLRFEQEKQQLEEAEVNKQLMKILVESRNNFSREFHKMFSLEAGDCSSTCWDFDPILQGCVPKEPPCEALGPEETFQDVLRVFESLANFYFDRVRKKQKAKVGLLLNRIRP
jgi:hypothetical protein